ncbi:hypothetical protein [Luteimonas lutimaris]|uniref:Uncharacterized protein n=1 Tax=Luteimonas lutimaris TaxID=698645 RepID=A0ABP7MFB3_9GAMM|nr:hypothetical protein [Luteimonas sp.]
MSQRLAGHASTDGIEHGALAIGGVVGVGNNPSAIAGAYKSRDAVDSAAAPPLTSDGMRINGLCGLLSSARRSGQVADRQPPAPTLSFTPA